MPTYLPLSTPNISGNEQSYVADALSQGWVAGGSYIDRFERALAGYVGAPSAAACQSGTSGIHLALIELGVGAGQEVLVPALTFIAAVNPVKYTGAQPVFMDCDDTLCMDMDKLARFCARECDMVGGKLLNRRSGRHVSCVVAVHVFGNLADMDKLAEIAGTYNLSIVEDATEALGSRFPDGGFAGTRGDVGIFSFNGNKIITTGGGGMIVAKNQDCLAHMRYLSQQSKDDELYFVHNEIGYNYRMTNIQAAIGLAQLEQLEGFIDHKRDMYELYGRLGVELLPFRADIRPNYWFYSYMTEHRDELISYMQENGVQCRPVWHLINELKPYRDCQSFEIEKARYYWERIVNIPCSTHLTESDAARVAQLIKNFRQGR